MNQEIVSQLIPDFNCGLRFPIQFEVILIEVESFLGLRNFLEVYLKKSIEQNILKKSRKN